MVTVDRSQPESLIILEPNRSATWRQNKWLLMIFAAWFTVVGGAFASIGAWVILPFAGLEMAGLGAGLYAVCWKLSHRHILRFNDEQLTIEKGVYYPRQVWHFPRSHTSVSVMLQPHPWDPLKIAVCGPWENVPVGDFLNKDDSKRLLEALRQQGMAVRNYSAEGATHI